MARGEGTTHGRAPARRIVGAGLCRPRPLREGEVRGLFGLARGCGTVPLPHLGLSRVATATAVRAPFLAQGAGDGVGDVVRGASVRVGRWHGGPRRAPLRGTGTRHSHASDSSSPSFAAFSLLLLVFVESTLFQDGLKVTAGGALRTADATG